MSTVKRVRSFVQRVTDSAAMEEAEAALAGDIVVGISTKKSVLLSEISRALDAGKDVPLLRTEQRLSKGLRKASSGLDELPEAYLREVASVARSLPFVTVDGTDHTHPYGRAFEHLCWVSDRSAPGKPIKPGYWGVMVEATDGAHRHLPLFFDLFSTTDPDYLALGPHAWQAQFQAAIDIVRPFAAPDATWLFDRGFDDRNHLAYFAEHIKHHVVRMCRSRDVQVGSLHDPATWNVGDLADGLRTPYSVSIPYVDKKTHKPRRTGRSFGFIPVRLPGVSHTYCLFVVRGGQGEDWLLLSNWMPKSGKEAAEIVLAYVQRWGSEETTRCFKQCTGIEKMRIRGFAAMRRLTWLAMVALGLQALWLFKNHRWARTVMARVKVFVQQVLFEHYRLWEGTAVGLATKT